MSHAVKSLASIVRSHKAFAVIVFGLIFMLLIRIPMGTFNDSSTLDTISHFMLPAFATPLLYVFLRQESYLPALPKGITIFLITLIGLAGEVVWEIFEFNVDHLFNLQWQLSNQDTMHDLILGLLGSLFGSYAYFKYYGTSPNPAPQEAKPNGKWPVINSPL